MTECEIKTKIDLEQIKNKVHNGTQMYFLLFHYHFSCFWTDNIQGNGCIIQRVACAVCILRGGWEVFIHFLCHALNICQSNFTCTYVQVLRAMVSTAIYFLGVHLNPALCGNVSVSGHPFTPTKWNETSKSAPEIQPTDCQHVNISFTWISLYSPAVLLRAHPGFLHPFFTQ